MRSFKLKIINTGGTFNKVYDPLAGALVVAPDNSAVEAAVGSMRPGCEMEIAGLLYKDSLDMDDADRQELCEAVGRSEEERIVIVHGTDTIGKSAEAVDLFLKERHEKRVVLTGAMIPFSIDPVEATANLASAVTAVRYLKPGVYIAMHGFVLPYQQIEKNRERGVFGPAE
ncbi:asparaginase domain-containing protein [Hydrogenimonas sp.]